jgi:hypothetical protein
MSNVLVVSLLALVINLWANDGSAANGSWPEWAIRRLMPLICTAAIVLVLGLWRSDRVAGQVALRVSVVTLLAALLNIVPFIFKDLSEYVNASPARLQPQVPLIEAFGAQSSVFGLFDVSGYWQRAAQGERQAQYDAALNACMEEKHRKQQHQPDNSLRFECVSNASHIGPAAFIARYSRPSKPVVRTK